jgi:hypothetical protein
VAGSCECGDEPSGSDATDLVSYPYFVENKYVPNTNNSPPQRTNSAPVGAPHNLGTSGLEPLRPMKYA